MKIGNLFLGIPVIMTGCISDPIIGEWNLFRENGGPISNTIDDCTAITQMQLQIDEDLETQALYASVYNGNDCNYNDTIIIYQGEAIPFDEKRSKDEHGHYEILISSSDEELALGCVLDSNAEVLSCSLYGLIWDFQ